MPRKSATWETALLPPPPLDFFARKIRRLRPGSNPRSWVPDASMLTTRPLDHYKIVIHVVGQTCRTHSFNKQNSDSMLLEGISFIVSPRAAA